MPWSADRAPEDDSEEGRGRATGGDEPDSECPAPVWGRAPPRVTVQHNLQHNDDRKLVFSIRGRVIDVVNDADEPEE
jgi:hypothetical protein